MDERSLRFHFSVEKVLAFLEEEEVEYKEMEDDIYNPGSDVDLGVDSHMEETGAVAWKLKKTVQKTGHNGEDLCIADSQQYFCIAQLTFYSEAGPTADVGQRDGVAPTDLEGLRYKVNVKTISMITMVLLQASLHSHSSQSIKWRSALTLSKCSFSASPRGLSLTWSVFA